MKREQQKQKNVPVGTGDEKHTAMKKMYNLTLHDEIDNMEIFHKNGFDIDPTPRLISPPYGRTPHDPDTMMAYAKMTISQLPEDAEAILIGGLTDLMIYIYNLLKDQMPDVKIYIASTQRHKKTNTFDIVGLREVI